MNLITNGLEFGVITQTTSDIPLPKGATRKVLDYHFDYDAERLIRKMALSYKLNKTHLIRNEASILALIYKYCMLKGMIVEFQYQLEDYIYDLRCDADLIEFDEPQHTEKRHILVDKEKDIVARRNNFRIIRVTLDDDVVDIILKLSPHAGF